MSLSQNKRIRLQKGLSMTVREEFIYAYYKEFPISADLEYPAPMNVAYWAARWMAERCAKQAEEWAIEGSAIAEELRQLAKELQ